MEKAANGRGLLAAFSPTECFQQLVQEHCLAFQDLKSRLGNAKPRRASTQEMIAVAQTAEAIPSRTCCSEDRRVPVLFNCPHVDDLAARCWFAERRFAARMVAGLFGELTLCGRKRGFARPNQAFRNGPGTLILTTPKRAARVAKQDSNALVPLTEEQETCTVHFGRGAFR